MLDGDDDFPDGAILRIEAEDSEKTQTPHEDRWLIEMSTFLSTGFPSPQMQTNQKKRLVVRSRNFCQIQDTLYHKGNDGIWHRCILSDEKEATVREAHCRIAGGHYAGNAMARKVWQVGLW